MKITIRITDKSPSHSRLSLWVNHGLTCTPGGICLRNEEVEPFIRRTNAESIELGEGLKLEDFPFLKEKEPESATYTAEPLVSAKDIHKILAENS